jgi:hypothetical protein
VGTGWQPGEEGRGAAELSGFAVQESGGGAAARTDGLVAFDGNNGRPDDLAGNVAAAPVDGDVLLFWDPVSAQDTPGRTAFTGIAELDTVDVGAVDTIFADWMAGAEGPEGDYLLE